ncbi:MAG TPA: diacylglycerol kinase family protein [Candidatus Lustribacter sp.]|nr:diacylglycerol kinase family protein [Candidatus Lustribacter sp.]
MPTPTEVWIAIAVAAVVIALVAVAVVRGRRSPGDYDPILLGLRLRRRPHRDHFRPEGHGDTTAPPLKRIAVVVNPTKFEDLAAVRRSIATGCRESGWGEPIWLETTQADPGTGQARLALEQGADMVCPLGGDGTVRTVAMALAGTETPLGLLPAGTGNLLARNLDLPVYDLSQALKVALLGRNKRIDVGRLTVDLSGEHERPEEHLFLVMAGFGFDAAVMADAPEKLKAAVGSAAYVVSGLKNLGGQRFKVRVSVDGGPEFTRRTRTVLIGNCGKLFGGLVLMPEAKVDDGILNAVIISPKGLVGWAAVLARVATQQRKGHERVDHHSGREIHVRADRLEAVQVDGDTVGQARVLTAVVEPGALVVRIGA